MSGMANTGDKADKGFRYGIRADRRFGGLSFEVEYEDPEEAMVLGRSHHL